MAETLFSQATRGLSIVTSTLCGGVVRVDVSRGLFGGAGTWLCEKSEWDAAKERLLRRPTMSIGMDALCALEVSVGGTIVSTDPMDRMGTAEEQRALIVRAVEANVLSPENAERMFGVWVQE